jgi:PilZ domain
VDISANRFLVLPGQIAFIAASRMIAKIYNRRRDVLYGPYRDTLS